MSILYSFFLWHMTLLIRKIQYFENVFPLSTTLLHVLCTWTIVWFGGPCWWNTKNANAKHILLKAVVSVYFDLWVLDYLKKKRKTNHLALTSCTRLFFHFLYLSLSAYSCFSLLCSSIQFLAWPAVCSPKGGASALSYTGSYKRWTKWSP